jgi:hypothetical protein
MVRSSFSFRLNSYVPFLPIPIEERRKKEPHPSQPLSGNSEEKKLQDKVKTLEYSIRTISLKKRELENEIRKIEMESLMDDKSNPYDTELKLDKLKTRLEELSMNEERKLDELEEANRSLNDYLSPNQ